MPPALTYIFISCHCSSAEFPKYKSEAVHVCLEEGLEGVLVDGAVKDFRGHVPSRADTGVVTACVDLFRFTENVKSFIVSDANRKLI